MEVRFRYSKEHSLLILSPDYQIHVRHGCSAQMYYADVYKLQYICSGAQPRIFYGRGGFGKKRRNICKALLLHYFCDI